MRDIRTLVVGLTLAGVSLAALVGCSADTTTSKQEASWPEPLLAVSSSHIGTPPPFPDDSAGWTLEKSWTVQARAFEGRWVPIAGEASDEYRFPASQNGCDQNLSLVRWRNITGTDTAIRYGIITGTGPIDPAIAEPSTPVVGTAGWMILDGCQTPEVSMLADETDGSTLTNIVVDIQQFSPAV